MAQTMHSGVTHERCADFRGEFITPPRPTGRRSNKYKLKEKALKKKALRKELKKADNL